MVILVFSSGANYFGVDGDSKVCFYSSGPQKRASLRRVKFPLIFLVICYMKCDGDDLFEYNLTEVEDGGYREA